MAQTAPLTARKQWLAGHLQVKGKVSLDAGASRALIEGGKSLLPIGVTAVVGEFVRGELVACLNQDGQEIARGLINYSSSETRQIMRKVSADIEKTLGYSNEAELLHRDNLILLI